MLVKDQTDGREVSIGDISLTWSAPDLIKLRIEGSEEGQEEQVFQVISAEGRVFARELATGDIWVEYETNPNPDNREVGGVLAMVRRFSSAPDFVPVMDEAELVGIEVIDGFSVYHVKGTRSVRQEIPDENPDGIFDDMPLQHDDSSYDLYVGASDFLPRRLLTETNLWWETSEGEMSGPEPVYIELTDEFLDYNVPVNIELPEVP